jgi:hypothetical protein
LRLKGSRKLIGLCSHLVDIFAMVPQTMPPHPTTTFPAQDARLLRYQEVLAKMSTHQLSDTTNQHSNESTQNFSDGWVSDEDNVEEVKSGRSIKSETSGPLLGGFSDAEAVE